MISLCDSWDLAALGSWASMGVSYKDDLQFSVQEEQNQLWLINVLKFEIEIWATRKSSCVNARGIPPARGRKMLTPPRQLDLTPPPPCQLDLTPPPKLDLTPPPPVGWLTWPSPPPAGWTWPPPPCGQTNKVKLLPSRRTTYAGGKNKLGRNEIEQEGQFIQTSETNLDLWFIDVDNFEK